MEVYLDNSATTACFPEVARFMTEIMCEHYGNPSSMHRKGLEAEHYIKEAKDTLARILKVDARELIFTSGGTEADNLALIGCAWANHRSGRHIISTKIEHPAVLETLAYLEKQGFEVTYLPVDENGIIRLTDLEAALRKDTIIVSIMHTNNEIGSLQPIAEAGQLIKRMYPKCLFHVDAVQGFGKARIYPKKMNIDLLSASSHKIHGPKGVGFLYVSDKVKIVPINFGGGQQKNLRSGTENVAGIVGMGKAAELAYKNMRKCVQRETMLRNYMIERILHEIPNARLNGHPFMRLPGNVNISFKGIEGASLLMLLEEDGICASGGSACNTGESRISYVIEALDVPKAYAPGTVRLTLCGDTTKEEVDHVVFSLKQNVAKLTL